MTFSDGTTVLGTVSVVAGSAALTVPALVLGVHDLTAVYNGNGILLARAPPRSCPAR